MAGYYDRAAKHTQVAASTTTNIESGESVTIYGIIITGDGGAGQVTLNEGVSAGDFSSVTEVGDFQVASGESFESQTCWMADKGLQVVTAANTKVTVFHSHPSA